MDSDAYPAAGGLDRGPSAAADPASLLKRTARGDEQAFAELYDETSRRVHGLVLRVIKDPAQAQEVTQEVYLDVWRSASRYQPGRGSAVAWILTIAHRKAVDRVRSAEASSRRETTYEQHNQAVEHDSTAEAAHASLEARRVRAALAGLTPAQREAIELAYLGGYTHAEIALLLDLPLGTAKTRIRDGMIRLRDQMGGE